MGILISSPRLIKLVKILTDAKQHTLVSSYPLRQNMDYVNGISSTRFSKTDLSLPEFTQASGPNGQARVPGWLGDCDNLLLGKWLVRRLRGEERI